MKVEPPNPHVDELVWYPFPRVEERLELSYIDRDCSLRWRDCGNESVGLDVLEVLLKGANEAIRRVVLDNIIDPV